MPFTVISSKVFVALVINFMKRIHYHTETEAEIWPWNYCELFYRFSTLKIVEEQSVRNPKRFLYNVSKLAKQCRGCYSVGNTRGVTSFCQWKWSSVSLTVTLHTKVKRLFNIYTLDLKTMDLEFFSWFSNIEERSTCNTSHSRRYTF